MISRIATFRALQKQSIAAASLPTRAFAKKRTRKTDNEASVSEVEEESTPVEEPTPEPVQPK